MPSELEAAGNVLSTEQSVACEKTSRGCSTILSSSVVGIKRDIRATASVLSPTGAPEDGRIENVGAIGSRPLKPRMRLTAGRESFPNNEPDVVGAPCVHRVVKSDRFAFAICISAMFNLIGSLPFRGETVRNCAEVADPIVD
jgi:hypothetical protein